MSRHAARHSRPSPWQSPFVRALPMGLLCTLGAVVLSACGHGNTDPATPASPPQAPTGVQRGTLLSQPALVQAMSTSQVNDAITGDALIVVTGKAKCAVSVYKLQYNTVGGRSEPTTASAAVFVPSGGDGCSGPRPVVEYAHGTSTDRTRDVTQIGTDTESLAMLGLFAAQGYLVVAPNYTGYDTSTLPYHPYLVAQAQADDMVDALRAARSALPTLGVTASAQLFITGYSQGGHVAMATVRAMQTQYTGEFQVTASAPMSGPYALLQFVEGQVGGGPQSGGASLYTSMLLNGFQNSYGNVYAQPSDAYASPYDTTVPNLLPSADPNAKQQLPAGPDNTYRTLFDAGDGQPFLLTTAFRQAAAQPTSGFYQDLQRNDLTLDWAPSSPMILCHAGEDQIVFASNAIAAQQAFKARGVDVTRYDLEDDSTVSNAVHTSFEAAKAIYKAKAGSDTAGQVQYQTAYHGALTASFCSWLARDYFNGFTGG